MMHMMQDVPVQAKIAVTSTLALISGAASTVPEWLPGNVVGAGGAIVIMGWAVQYTLTKLVPKYLEQLESAHSVHVTMLHEQVKHQNDISRQQQETLVRIKDEMKRHADSMVHIAQSIERNNEPRG